MRKIIFVLMLLLSIPVLADIGSETLNSAGFNKLTDQQKAEILKNVADKVAVANEPDPKTKIDENLATVQKWSDVGTNLGKALAGSAKELGIAVNDFAKTDVGKLVTVLIIWNFFGNKFVHMFGGVFFMFCGIFGLRYMLRFLYPPKITYSSTEKNKFGNFIITSIENAEFPDGIDIAVMVIYFVIGAGSMILFFTG